MTGDKKIMPLNDLIRFASHIHRAELSDAVNTEKMATEIFKKGDHELDYILAMNGLSFWPFLNMPTIYIKAIRVTLVETGWDARWVEGVVRTLLDNSYLPVEPMEKDAAEQLAGEFRRFYPSEDDAEIIDKLVASRFNVHELM